jgi:hypothetical protein
VANQFISVPIVADENQLYQIGLARVQTTYPNWQPAPGSLADMMFRIAAGMAAVAATNASTSTVDIFQYLGLLAQIPPLQAVAASATVQFTAKDSNGYVIPFGTPVALHSTSDPTLVGFQTVTDLYILSGQTTGTVGVTARVPGANGNDLNVAQRADSLSYVASVALTQSSADGADAEQTSDYIDRLSRTLETWTLTPINARDFMLLAPSVPGVFRAGVLANYNPADRTTDNDKYVCLCPLDVDGNGVHSDLAAAVVSFFENLREVNFVCVIDSPVYTTIDVSYSAGVNATTGIATAEAAVATSLGNYLNSATWGAMIGTGAQLIPTWTLNNLVRLTKIAQAIEQTNGINWADDIQIAANPPGVLGSANIIMPGAFALPKLGTITPNVTVDN